MEQYFEKIDYLVIENPNGFYLTSEGRWTKNFNKAEPFNSIEDAKQSIKDRGLRKAIVTMSINWWIVKNNQMAKSGNSLINIKNNYDE